jgi:hypothetical protein
MSTKGMSSTAARTLIEKLCRHQVPLLALHDFDKAAFSIIGTLKRNTRRFTFSQQVKIIDIGLRLADVRALGLEASAEDAFDRGSASRKLENLRLNGATREEAEFLLTKRVELNALTSDQLVAFIERKLAKHGIKKLVPKADLLGDAYRLFVRSKRVEAIVEETIKGIEQQDVAVPANLRARVAAHLKQHPPSQLASFSRPSSFVSHVRYNLRAVFGGQNRPPTPKKICRININGRLYRLLGSGGRLPARGDAAMALSANT